MKFIKILALSVLCLFVTNNISQAETILSCKTTMEGHAYYHLGGLVKGKDAGWKKDKISNYEIELTLVGDRADIIFKDAYNRKISATADGGEVVIASGSQDYMHVIVMYPLTTELITFDIANSQLWLSQQKHNSQVKKSATFVGKCRY